ncbi:MAG: DinB family protein [Actinomycetales bacterium]|nr:DinB family protein [Actinomycetales bacterium]
MTDDATQPAPDTQIAPDTEIPPDTKDWTWVLNEACPECGLSVGGIEVRDVPALIRDTIPRWRAALAAPDARTRPAPATWSPLEYGAHVRDVHAVFGERLRLMLADDGARFANWDQDEAAVEGRYGELDPAGVAAELARAAEELAVAVEGVRPEQESRRGLRSNGSEFTVRTLLRYYLHDSLHHLHDVGA